jgi:hypothetical protein
MSANAVIKIAKITAKKGASRRIVGPSRIATMGT